MMGVAEPLTAGAFAPPFLPRMLAGGSRWLAIAAVLAMLVSVNIEVIGRSFFGHATIWVTEVTTYLVVAITFLGAAFVASREANVRVDLVLDLLPQGLREPVLKAQSWLSAFIVLTVLWKLAGFWFGNLESGARSWSLLNTPIWIPQIPAVAGMAGLAVVLMPGLSSGARPRNPTGYAPALLGLAYALAEAVQFLPAVLTPFQSVLLLLALTALSALLVSGWRTVLAMAAMLLPALLIFAATRDAALAVKAAGLVAVLFLLLLAGLPVAFSLLAVGLTTMVFWLPPVALNYVGERAWGAVSTFELAAIPMFVLMGAVLVRSNASSQMFAAARLGMGRTRGALAHASILASGVFAAVSGSSLATAATMGRVAGPEMIAEGYRPELAYGVLAAGGTLGILIPPSIAMIVYGPLAGVPVTELFMAGILPGLLMILAFAIVVLIWVGLDPSAAPTGRGADPNAEPGARRRALIGVAPFLGLMTLVLGSLYAGFATPTEAGAVGVLGALAIGLARGALSLREFAAALEEAVLATSFLLMIAVGAAVMSFGVDFLSMPQALVATLNAMQLSDLALFAAIVVLFLFLGMFVEPISMVLMTLPILMPVIVAAGWDPLWFGVILVMLVEIGLITPPVGMILFVLAGVSNGQVPLGRIAVGTLPFVAAFLGMILVFFAMPGLVTLVPDLLR